MKRSKLLYTILYIGLVNINLLAQEKKLAVLGHMITRAPRGKEKPEPTQNKERIDKFVCRILETKKLSTKNLDSEELSTKSLEAEAITAKPSITFSQESSNSNWLLEASSELSFETLRKTLQLQDLTLGTSVIKVYNSRGDVNGNLIVIQPDNVLIAGDTQSNGAIKNKGNITSDGDLAVGGQATIGAILLVKDSTTLEKNLSVGGSTNILGSCDIGDNSTIAGDLTISGTIDLSGYFHVHDHAHFYQQVTLQPDENQSATIQFNQYNETEKARISTSSTPGERGLFISVDDGTTQNLLVTGTGTIQLNNPGESKISMRGYNTNDQSFWDITAGTHDSDGIARRTFSISDTYNDKTILKIYDSLDGVDGNLLECNTTSMLLTGTGICTLWGGLTVTTTAQGLAPITIENNNITVSNGNIQSTNACFEEHLAIGTDISETDALRVVGRTNITGDIALEGLLATTGDIDLGQDSAITREEATLIHTFGNNNIYIGSDAGYVSFLTFGAMGTDNTALGSATLFNIEAGSKNVALGSYALYELYDGNENVAIGYQAGQNYQETETNNICIGSNVAGEHRENNTIRLGNSIDQTYIDGIHEANLEHNALIVGITDEDQLGTSSPLFTLNGPLETSYSITATGNIQHSLLTTI